MPPQLMPFNSSTWEVLAEDPDNLFLWEGIDDQAAIWAATASPAETRLAIIMGRAAEEHQEQQELLQMQRQEQELRMAPVLAQPKMQPRARAAAKAAAESANDFAIRCSRRADRMQWAADKAARRGKKRTGRLQRDAEDARSEATTAWAAAQAAEAEYQSICSIDSGIRQESSPHPPPYPPPLWRAGTSASSGSGRSRPY